MPSKNEMEIPKQIEEIYALVVAGIEADWLQGKGDKWYKYIVELPADPKTVYLVVVLNNQVINGGFHQYFANGYGQFAEETVEALQIIGANKPANLLQDAYQMIRGPRLAPTEFRRRLLCAEIKALFTDSHLIARLSELDDLYYQCEDIVDLLETYLSRS